MPTINFSTNQSFVDISGTAQDNVGVTLVTWANDRGGGGTAFSAPAPGQPSVNWSVLQVPLQFGVNVVTITAFDAAGNTGVQTLTVNCTSTFPVSPVQIGPSDKYCGFPAMAMGGGVIVVAFGHANGHVAANNTPLYAYRSLDNGNTWSSPILIFQDPGYTAGGGGMVYTQAGHFLYTFTRLVVTGGVVTQQDSVWSRSTDGGLTWSAPVVFDSNSRGDGGQIVQMANGAILAPVYDTAGAYVRRSTDNGSNWGARILIGDNAADGLDYSETGFAVRQGAAYAEVRSDITPQFTSYRSLDNGLTWTKLGIFKSNISARPVLVFLQSDINLCIGRETTNNNRGQIFSSPFGTALNPTPHNIDSINGFNCYSAAFEIATGKIAIVTASEPTGSPGSNISTVRFNVLDEATLI